MNVTPTAIMPQIPRIAITVLRRTAGDLFALFAGIKQADWKARPDTFFQLNELALQIMGHLDRVAERLALFGGLNDGMLQDRLTTVQRHKRGHSTVASDPMQDLVKLHGTTSSRVRAAVKQLVKAEDFGTADLLADILRTLEVNLSLLEAYHHEHSLPEGYPNN